MRSYCAWILVDGKTLTSNGSYGHNSLMPHDDAFKERACRVVARDNTLAFQWAGELSNAQKRTAQSIIREHDFEQIYLEGADCGYDPESSLEYKTDTDATLNGKLCHASDVRHINMALNQKYGEWRE